MQRILGFLASLLLLFNLTHAQEYTYKVVDRLKLGGEGGWDYLLADSWWGRVYISRGTHVQVLDIERQKVVGDILNTNGVHGIAVADDLKKGYISDGKDTSVTVFDLKSLNVIKVIKIKGLNPDCIIFDDYSRQVFTFNGRSSDATVIDAIKDTVVGTLALEGKPEFAVSDGKGKIFVNIEDKSLITVFESRTLKILGKWPLAPGEGPSGLAIDREHNRLFSVCSNKLMVILDAESGRLVTTVPTGEGTDAAAYDPGSHYAFSSNGEGTLTIVREDSPDKFTVVDSVKTQRGARTMAIDARSHRIYLSTAEFGPPPEATKERPHPRPSILPGSFILLVLDRVQK